MSSFCIAWHFSLGCNAVPPPDAKALVMGVESSRLQIPPSKMRLHMVFETALSATHNNTLVEFDGEERRFENIGSESSERGFFDGTQVGLFDGRELTLRNITDATTDAMFDPRLLGLTVIYSWEDTLSGALPYRTASSIKMVGLEDVNGESAWHIQIINESPSPERVDLWTSKNEDFRVLKYQVSFDGGYDVAVSYYNQKSSWLPSMVKSQSFSSGGMLRFQLEVSILEARAYVDFPKNNWTIAGLQVPVGTDIVDRRILRRIGTWNGNGIQPEAGDSAGSAPDPKETRIMLLFLFVISIIPFIYLINKKK